MEKKLDRRRVRTRAAVLDAAEGLFVERGFKGTTIEALAAEADVATSSIYLAFPGGKSDVYVALALRAVAVNEEMLDAAHAAGGGPVERLRAIADAYARFHLQHPLALRLIALHDVEAPDARLGDARAVIRTRLDAMLARVAAVVDELLTLHGGPAVQPLAAATFLWGAWNGTLALHARGMLSEAELRAVLGAGQTLVLEPLGDVRGP